MNNLSQPAEPDMALLFLGSFFENLHHAPVRRPGLCLASGGEFSVACGRQVSPVRHGPSLHGASSGAAPLFANKLLSCTVGLSENFGSERRANQ
jgi:hypothetical protein